mmetsp:Transcript_18055/g.59300  ORF Transcript_18055/g.59300 Transcript_18055/m.59300 type:complete len:121 (-) Transcript_18055:734-1096(-)
MKLYLRAQLRDVSYARFGGEEGLLEESRRRKNAQYERKRKTKATESVLRKKEARERNPEAVMTDDGTAGLYGVAGAKIQRKSVGQARHVHGWGEEWWDEGARTWKMKCKECGQVKNFDKL